MDFIEFVMSRKSEIMVAVGQHLNISLTAVLLAIAVGVPMGIFITRYEKSAGLILGIANTLQTIPSLALFGIMLPLLGIGYRNAMVVLFLYALLPIIKKIPILG